MDIRQVIIGLILIVWPIVEKGSVYVKNMGAFNSLYISFQNLLILALFCCNLELSILHL